MEGLRRFIDECDLSIQTLLETRAAAAQGIGKIKKRNNMPIHVPERETVVIERLVQRNDGRLPEDEIRQVYSHIIGMCRRLQQ